MALTRVKACLDQVCGRAVGTVGADDVQSSFAVKERNGVVAGEEFVLVKQRIFFL